MVVERGLEHVVRNRDGKLGERMTYPALRRPPRQPRLIGTATGRAIDPTPTCRP